MLILHLFLILDSYLIINLINSIYIIYIYTNESSVIYYLSNGKSKSIEHFLFALSTSSNVFPLNTLLPVKSL